MSNNQEANLISFKVVLTKDGTIMTEHSMGTNDNSQVVTTSRPRTNVNRRRTTRTGGHSPRNV